MTDVPRNAELAQLEREAHLIPKEDRPKWLNPKEEYVEYDVAIVIPGDMDEANILARIDEARYQEVAQLSDTPQDRRGRVQRYVRKHGL